MTTTLSIKEIIVRNLQNSKALFKEAKARNNPILSINIIENYPQKRTSHTCKNGCCTWITTNKHHLHYIACARLNMGIYDSESCVINEADIDNLLAILERTPIANTPEPNQPRNIGCVDSGLVYNLSKCYDVLLLQKQGKLSLLLDQDVGNMSSHNQIHDTMQPFIAEFYLKYDSQKMNADLRDSVLPAVNSMYYCCQKDAEYINLPNTASGAIQISNNGSHLLHLTPSEYAKYVKISPKYLQEHKYVNLVDGEFEINYLKYCIDYFNCTDGSKYYFSITESGGMIITYGKPNEEYCVLTHDAIEHFKGTIKVAKYCPASVTNLIGELDEIKQLIAPLDVKLSVAFDY